ncbi:RecQ family ATP-dependent DNA helicase [Amphibacillus cookii]|uniref:RecQ family ATP-dependent DNA helicase n=1 Tax=Amphibacillus cookii TaxID=767787 RepID=UPI001956C974|nr:RecQ family ATP-dependent DNA helicase [Amphibacillus cookii]MBM7542494.1 ATP-dependent DNA helicase RecQ [Amphibacillus cookii]
MENLENSLERYFSYKTFRTGQKEIISDIMAGQHVLATLPTGAGKSICYQLPALLVKGGVIVVTPLLSLMEDQVKQMKQRGYSHITSLNTFNTEQERLTIIRNLHKYKLIFLSPEMLQNQNVLKKLMLIDISLFVIDEAHCISQWGHEFRPDYLKLNNVIVDLKYPTILALTATATPDVQKDVISQLASVKFKKHIYPMDRDNIALYVKQVDHHHEKDRFIIAVLERYNVPTMIYFSSKKETERVASIINQRFDQLNVAYYHGDLDTSDRLLIQQQFMENQLDVICCTSAFGMGINKSDIRLIIHYHLPTQLESFIQEVGRAGRDQLESVSITLISPNDHQIPQRLIESELPSLESVEMLWSEIELLSQSKLTVKVDTNEWAQRYNFSEVHLRFIKNFLEAYGILKYNKYIVSHSSIHEAKIAIINKIKERSRYKKHKLNELLNWLATSGCRRQRLYAKFQSHISPAKYQCCDRCGFDLFQWQPKQSGYRQRINDYLSQLKSVMIPFNEDE